jgi:hypothetical protein
MLLSASGGDMSQLLSALPVMQTTAAMVSASMGVGSMRAVQGPGLFGVPSGGGAAVGGGMLAGGGGWGQAVPVAGTAAAAVTQGTPAASLFGQQLSHFGNL